MNLHNTISDSCDKCPFYCTCCLYDATESRQITKNEQINTKNTIKRCALAQQLHTLTHAERRTADQSGCFTLGLWKRWREPHHEGRGVIIISVFGGTGSCKVQRRSVWFGCSISRDPSVLFSLTVLKDTLIMPLCGKVIADVMHTRQR